MPDLIPTGTGRPLFERGRPACVALLCFLATAGAAAAGPYVPADENLVLAHVPAGAAHSSVSSRQQAAARLDVALPLAQFYISQARATSDLRFLGYAEAVLRSWSGQPSVDPAVRVLQATILQSRHQFAASLVELDAALRARPDDAQAWLTRATVLRVMGRYDEALVSCERLRAADPGIGELCKQSVRALNGHLRLAYEALQSLPREELTNAARAWRYSELGEQAARLGDDSAAAGWFEKCLRLAPDDLYTRTAYADLLLSEGRPGATLELLKGYGSMEPMLLRIAIAQLQLGDPRLSQSRPLLASAFAVEEERGEAVHRREQARFLLDVERQPFAALLAAQQNWRVQREPADVLILLRAAQAAHQPAAAQPAQQWLTTHRTEDVRFAPYLARSQ
ncbi:MAG: hypothetical protein JSR67_15055 [Proteobacteria bacterium]|nr:hypothetical protein [Pseudomonadota bacterium]